MRMNPPTTARSVMMRRAYGCVPNFESTHQPMSAPAAMLPENSNAAAP